ncbi:MAG TPA: cytochrome c oxidase subunit 4 [Candidatus Baltobacteraceae bacterium]|nr:cytochrome c oxidase subunit 4 [Candidatus Baltobacteraceae bacterium]
MKSFVGIFGCSAGFGFVIALVYWWVAHEETVGTVLLGVMTAALVFAAIYAVIGERSARLDGDEPDLTNADAAGEDLGVFTTSSPYPILIAAGAGLGLLGLLWSPLIGIAGLTVVVLCLWRMGAESSRV